MNTIGVSCTGFCTSAPAEILERVSKDFSHWEIFSEVDHMVQGFDEEFIKLYDSKDITYSLHTSIANTDIAALNPRMREASVMELLVEMECAASMGMSTVTIHPGLNCLSVPGCRDRCIAAARESCRILDRAAQQFGLDHVCIENMPNLPIMLGNTAEELLSIVDGTNLGITFDIGHANTAGQIDAMIDTFGDRIAHVHIHDNNGQKDEHLTIGEGTIDFKDVIGKLSKYAGCYIIEARSYESAVESQKVLKNLLGQ